jgi:hypothetical protein
MEDDVAMRKIITHKLGTLASPSATAPTANSALPAHLISELSAKNLTQHLGAAFFYTIFFWL